MARQSHEQEPRRHLLTFPAAESLAAPISQPTPPSQEEREHGSGRDLGPDVVRVIAAFFVVYLHACIAYLEAPMPGLVWPIRDTPSRFIGNTFWLIEIFIMPLFLIVAGFYAQRSWANGGGGRLIRSRVQRLLKPLAFAAIVLLPLEYYLWLTGWVIEGALSADRLWTLKVPRMARQHLMGTAHLWFLLYLFLYCVVLSAMACLLSGSLVKRGKAAAFPADKMRLGHLPHSSSDGMLARLRSALGQEDRRVRRAQSVGILVAGIAILTAAPQVVFGFQHGFLPVPSKWLYSGTYFLGGVWIAAQNQGWRICGQRTGRFVTGGLISGTAAVLMGQWAIETASPISLVFAIGWLPRLVLASLTVITAWSLSLGIIGFSNRIAPHLSDRRGVPEVIAYLAAAGFWVYLIHHPLVALLHLDLKFLLPGASPEIKWGITLVASLGVCLASYHVCIRGNRFATKIGIEVDSPKNTTTQGDAADQQITTTNRVNGERPDAAGSLRRVA
jgi:glucan biosynthesis protein C